MTPQKTLRTLWHFLCADNRVRRESEEELDAVASADTIAFFLRLCAIAEQPKAAVPVRQAALFWMAYKAPLFYNLPDETKHAVAESLSVTLSDSVAEVWKAGHYTFHTLCASKTSMIILYDTLLKTILNCQSVTLGLLCPFEDLDLHIDVKASQKLRDRCESLLTSSQSIEIKAAVCSVLSQVLKSPDCRAFSTYSFLTYLTSDNPPLLPSSSISSWKLKGGLYRCLRCMPEFLLPNIDYLVEMTVRDLTQEVEIYDENFCASVGALYCDEVSDTICTQLEFLTHLFSAKKEEYGNPRLVCHIVDLCILFARCTRDKLAAYDESLDEFTFDEWKQFNSLTANMGTVRDYAAVLLGRVAKNNAEAADTYLMERFRQACRDGALLESCGFLLNCRFPEEMSLPPETLLHNLNLEHLMWRAFEVPDTLLFARLAVTTKHVTRKQPSLWPNMLALLQRLGQHVDTSSHLTYQLAYMRMFYQLVETNSAYFEDPSMDEALRTYTINIIMSLSAMTENYRLQIWLLVNIGYCLRVCEIPATSFEDLLHAILSVGNIGETALYPVKLYCVERLLENLEGGYVLSGVTQLVPLLDRPTDSELALKILISFKNIVDRLTLPHELFGQIFGKICNLALSFDETPESASAVLSLLIYGNPAEVANFGVEFLIGVNRRLGKYPSEAILGWIVQKRGYKEYFWELFSAAVECLYLPGWNNFEGANLALAVLISERPADVIERLKEPSRRPVPLIKLLGRWIDAFDEYGYSGHSFIVAKAACTVLRLNDELLTTERENTPIDAVILRLLLNGIPEERDAYHEYLTDFFYGCMAGHVRRFEVIKECYFSESDVRALKRVQWKARDVAWREVCGLHVRR